MINTTEIQPCIPTVYAEPVELKDIKYKIDTDELVNLVNDHSQRVADAAREDAERIERAAAAEYEAKKRRTKNTIYAALVIADAFFTMVGIHTCYVFLFGG